MAVEAPQAVESLRRFKQRSDEELLERLKQTGEPVLLTIGGRAELVVQDVTSFSRAAERAAELEEIQAIHQGIRAVDEGRTRPAADAFAALREKYGLPD